MKIKHQDCHIDRELPFTNCKLGREKYANILTQIVGNYKDGFVLAINNEWGTGKTTFVKMWQQQLVNKGYNTLYFNSWENDFDANPLVAIMSELKTLTKPENTETFKSLVSKGAILTKNILPQLLKILSKKYVGTEDLADLVKDSTEGAAELLTDEIKEYGEKKKGLKEFKDDLEKYISETNSEKPLIFIIDELDRCRPSYAVELLEQIKHLFSVPGIVFVLSIDKVQLGHAVRGVYGSENINSDEYLRRFIDVEYTLPQPSSKDFCNYLYAYFELNDFFESDERKRFQVFKGDKEALLGFASMLFEKANITLRQQEKIFAHARIGLTFFKENQYTFPDLFIVLILLKHLYKEFYDRIKMKVFEPQELINEFFTYMPKGIPENKIRYFINIEALLVFLYNNSLTGHNSENLIKKDYAVNESAVLVASRLDNSENDSVFSHFLLENIRHREIDNAKIDYLINKIDLSENISN